MYRHRYTVIFKSPKQKATLPYSFKVFTVLGTFQETRQKMKFISAWEDHTKITVKSQLIEILWKWKSSD